MTSSPSSSARSRAAPISDPLAATETRKYKADDLRGAGAAKNPGRWNDDGQAVVYTAPTVALTVLETAAHVDDSGLPLNRYLVRIDVPDALWTARAVLQVAALPATRAAIPAGRASVQAGGDWLRGCTTLLLEVPSVIVPEESAVLINPLHSDATKLSATVVRLFEYNRFFRGT